MSFATFSLVQLLDWFLETTFTPFHKKNPELRSRSYYIGNIRCTENSILEMVCVPCIVIPVLLWIFHKFIQPLISTFWPWSKTESIKDGKGCSQTVKDTKPKVS